jgi:hypothetical protein
MRKKVRCGRNTVGCHTRRNDMNDRIEIGDKVNIFFNTADAIFDAEIIDHPHAEGDCWRVKTEKTLYNVQQFNYMEKLVKEEYEE